MKIARGCFGTKQYNEKNSMCRGCPFRKACKISLKRRIKSWLEL